MAEDQTYKQTGIANRGNQCYFNSTLQALASCPSVYNILLGRRIIDNTILQVIKDQKLLNIQLEDLQSKCTQLIESDSIDSSSKTILEHIQRTPTDVYIYLDWRNIMLGLIKNHSSTLHIESLVNLLRYKVNVRAFQDLFSGAQCDPHEAIVFLLDVLHRYCSRIIPNLNCDISIPGLPIELREIYQKQFIREYASGYSEFVVNFHNSYLSTIQCQSCQHAVYNISPMTVIDIPLPHASSANLLDCISRFFNAELVDKYKCDKCSSVDTSIMGKQLLKSARTIIIELKRFINLPNGSLAKNNIGIAFPEVIDMTPYLVDKRRKIEYKLNAIIVHASTHIGFGHYYCVSRKLGSDIWFVCDDAFTKQVPMEIALGQSGAYLLFYTMEE